LDNPVVKHRLKFLLKYLVLVPTDKAAKNFAFICRHHYQKVLNDELNSNDGAYADCDLNKMSIFDTFQGELYKGRRRVPPYIIKEIDSINEKVAKTGRCDNLFNLPLMYWIPKMHKKVPKVRFTAGSANVLTTRLARVVNVLLSQLKKELKKLDKEHTAETGVKRCLFVDTKKWWAGYKFWRDQNRKINGLIPTILALCTPCRKPVWKSCRLLSMGL